MVMNVAINNYLNHCFRVWALGWKSIRVPLAIIWMQCGYLPAGYPSNPVTHFWIIDAASIEFIQGRNCFQHHIRFVHARLIWLYITLFFCPREIYFCDVAFWLGWEHNHDIIGTLSCISSLPSGWNTEELLSFGCHILGLIPWIETTKVNCWGTEYLTSNFSWESYYY